jgi:hypothetical protein
MQSIEKALESVSFKEPEKPIEPPELEVVVPVEEVAEVVTIQAAPVTEVAVPIPEEKIEGIAPAEESKEEDFDKIFSLQNVMAAPPAAEEESEEERNKKKEKKAKKGRELEFDEKRGEVVARKKHKRGDDERVLDEWE